MQGMILQTYDMERLILEAYDDAQSNEFFAITSMLERLTNRRYSQDDPRGDVTTGAVRNVLERRGMNYTLGRTQQQPVVDIMYRINWRRGRSVLTVFK